MQMKSLAAALGIALCSTYLTSNAAQAANRVILPSNSQSAGTVMSRRGRMQLHRPHLLRVRHHEGGRRVQHDIPTGPFVYHGGNLLLNMHVYLVFWQWNNDPDNEAAYVTNYVRDVGGSSWLENNTQYTNGSGTAISNNAHFESGIWYDYTNPMPHDPQNGDFAQEAMNAQEHFGVNDPNAVYLIATPSGAQDQGNGFGSTFCAYHDFAYITGGTLPYINLPYQPDMQSQCYAYVQGGLLDGVSYSAGHELAESQTDPSNGGWWAPDSQQGVLDEVADLCQLFGQTEEQLYLLSGLYVAPALWDNQSSVCSYYLPKHWDAVGVGGTNDIWTLATDTVTGGHTLYAYSPPGYPANFYAVFGQGTDLNVDASGTPWVVSNKKLYNYSAYNGLNLYPSPSAVQVSVGPDGSIWLLGGKKKDGGYTVYEKGGALGYQSFAALGGVQAKYVSGAASGLGMVVDNKGKFRQYNPETLSWQIITSPTPMYQVYGSDIANSTFVLAAPQSSNGYELYWWDNQTGVYYNSSFSGIDLAVGPGADPYVIQNNHYLYHYTNGSFQNF